MSTYKRPMKNIGLLKYKNEKKERYISFDDLFDLVVSSFIVGLITGVILTAICLINR